MKFVIDPLIPEMPKDSHETSELQEHLWVMRKRTELLELLAREQHLEQNSEPKETD